MDERGSFAFARVQTRLAGAAVAALRPFGALRALPRHLHAVRRRGEQCEVLLYRLPAAQTVEPLLAALRAAVGEAELGELQLPPCPGEPCPWPMSPRLPRPPELPDAPQLLAVLRRLRGGEGRDACAVYDHEAGEVLAEAEAARGEQWPLRHAVIAAVNLYAESVRAQPGKYLLSAASVVCLYEPCMMCAMALVHSRVRGLLFAFPAPSHRGGFNARDNLLRLPLNHRFPAFRLEGECPLRL